MTNWTRVRLPCDFRHPIPLPKAGRVLRHASRGCSELRGGGGWLRARILLRYTARPGEHPSDLPSQASYTLSHTSSCVACSRGVERTCPRARRTGIGRVEPNRPGYPGVTDQPPGRPGGGSKPEIFPRSQTSTVPAYLPAGALPIVPRDLRRVSGESVEQWSLIFSIFRIIYTIWVRLIASSLLWIFRRVASRNASPCSAKPTRRSSAALTHSFRN